VVGVWEKILHQSRPKDLFGRKSNPVKPYPADIASRNFTPLGLLWVRELVSQKKSEPEDIFP